VLDTVLEDTAGRRYIARLYTYGGVIYYVVLISPKTPLGGCLRDLYNRAGDLSYTLKRRR
jgi:hypothetical protein